MFKFAYGDSNNSITQMVFGLRYMKFYPMRNHN